MAPVGIRKLVFIGFMAAGKSKAVAAARALGLDAADSDELLERELGTTIGEFFAAHGEAEFRRREEEVVLSMLERFGTEVIGLGGGAVLSERVREALAGHVVAWLRVEESVAWERVEGSDRPLARDRRAFAELHAAREPVYESLADAIVPAERESVRAAVPALLALRELPAETKLAWARSDSGSYPVFVGRGVIGSGYWPLDTRRFCVTDTTVGGLYGRAVEPLAGRVEVEPGEQAKTLGEAERVLRELAELGMTRADHVVALGGGSVGDLAGFCAATYQRGVDVVQVPTTLVAQVDSAYGGKTGVDLPEAKNYVGAYHLPKAVLADPATLDTLPREELAAGFAEVVKTGLIAGGPLWERVRSIFEPTAEGLGDVIFACVQTKLDVVAADERDAGRRAVLNLGHTVGHAIETASGYERYRHGEAVGLGLLAALRLSAADQLRAEVEAMLARHGLPTTLDRAIPSDDVLAAIERDKKRDAEWVRFVLLERPGAPRVGERVDPASLRAAVEELAQ